jgi:hypothetical protein
MHTERRARDQSRDASRPSVTAGRPRRDVRAALQSLQRTAGNRAVADLITVQRNGESADLLTELAIPQARPGPAIAVQADLVGELDKLVSGIKGDIFNLGGIMIDRLPGSDEELVSDPKLIALPKLGGFMTTGVPVGPAVLRAGLGPLVVHNTLSTMIDAQQIKYLRQAGLPNDEWKILVEVHYYRTRPQDQTGFHKDTLGETLFVNLNYHVDQPLVGPEYVVNPLPSPDHDLLIGGTGKAPGTLPPQFVADLAATRERLRAPATIGTDIIEPYGYVAFVDEAIHHSTPRYGHRVVTSAELKAFLIARYASQFKAATDGYAKYGKQRAKDEQKRRRQADKKGKKKTEKEAKSKPFSSYVGKKPISPHDSEKWLAWMEMTDDDRGQATYTRADLAGTMSSAEFGDLLDSTAAVDEPDRRGAAGFQAASIPKAGLWPITAKGTPPLKRQLSDPDFQKQIPRPLKAGEARRFFRTWVRAVPTEKAAKLPAMLEVEAKVEAAAKEHSRQK